MGQERLCADVSKDTPYDGPIYYPGARTQSGRYIIHKYYSDSNDVPHLEAARNVVRSRIASSKFPRRVSWSRCTPRLSHKVWGVGRLDFG